MARALRSSRRLIPLLLSALALAPAAVAPLIAQEEAAEPLVTSEAKDYLGRWILRMESPQGEFDAELAVLDVEGKAVAELELGPLGDHTVEDIVKTEEGILLTFEAGFGDLTFTVKMPVSRQGDELVGSLGESNGLFRIDFKGITEPKAQELEKAGLRRRIRARRRGPSQTERTRLTLADKAISIRFDKAKVEEPDFSQIDSIAEGEVVRFLRHQSTKLRTETDLRFGDAWVKTENVADDYPGVYSLWLQKTSEGWSLLFNEKADVWGTQHDAEADAASVPLRFSSDVAEEAATFTVELTEADGGGQLTIRWGPYQWETGFTVAAETSIAE